MTLRECYDSIGSNFSNAVTRMCGREDMLLKFAKKFVNDPTYSGLVSAYEGGDVQTAFRMAHTLKGVCLNLGLDKLEASSASLTEALRNAETFTDESNALYDQVKLDYDMTLKAISAVDDQ